MDTTPNSPLELHEPAPAQPAPPLLRETLPLREPLPLTEPLPLRDIPDPEARGCLFALSQPPLMLFLAVIAVLLAVTGAHDLLML